MLKRIIALCLLAALLLSALAACGEGNGGTVEGKTLFIYLCGSNLETKQGLASKNIDELLAADIGDMNIVIQTGGANIWRHHDISADAAQRYEIRNGESKLIETLEQKNMGEAETLTDFLSWGQQQYPTNHNMLVLWDHGGATKGVCYDENYGFDGLTFEELHRAFENAELKTKFDIIGFDACLMGSLETAALLKDYADYMIASEEIEPGFGWDYTVLLDAMSEKKTPAEVASSVCDGYKAKCESKNKAATATLAAIDLSKIDGVISLFTTALRDLESACGNEEDMLRTLTARSRTVEALGGMSDWEGMSNLIDLYDLADSLYNGENGSDAWKNLTNALDGAVVSCINGESTSSANGLSIWYPRAFDKNELDEYTSVTPLTEYAKILTDLLDVRLGQVAFEPGAAVTDDGKISVQILSAAKNAVSYMQVSNWELDFEEMVVDQNVDED